MNKPRFEVTKRLGIVQSFGDWCIMIYEHIYWQKLSIFEQTCLTFSWRNFFVNYMGEIKDLQRLFM